jgi:hypothetical protein
MLSLIDVAKERGAKDREKAYWNTYPCQNIVYTANSKIYAPFCKNRFCTYCCGIRKAELIKKYLPVLQSWKDRYFVTLTVKAVKANQLTQRHFLNHEKAITTISGLSADSFVRVVVLFFFKR